MVITQNDISLKLTKLSELNLFLKGKYVGIDLSIDSITSYMTPWYVFPDALLSPHVICLWGMIGCGKTSLVQDIVEFLGMASQFITTIDEYNIRKCNISNETSMILLLDEFQNERTKDEHGCRIELDFNNGAIWEFMSSGAINSMGFWSELMDFDDDGTLHGIPEIYQLLVRGKSKEEKISLLQKYGEQTRMLLPKTLIFVCGNVDSAYPGASDMDNESDADKYYELSKKVTLQDIRKELDKMFFPEHISRLGSNHVIFPTFNSDAYAQMIESKCAEIVILYENLTERHISINNSILKYLYEISVVPTQGARPVISTVRSFLGYYIPKALCDYEGNLNLSINANKLIINDAEIPLIEMVKRTNIIDVSEEDLIDCIVHEAGHITVAIALGIPPFSVSILSDKEAVSNFVKRIPSTVQGMKDDICIALAGKEAQLTVFNNYDGCSSDLIKATNLACQLIRIHKYSGIFDRYETNITPQTLVEDGCHNEEIQTLLYDMTVRVKQILDENLECFNECVKILRNERKINNTSMEKLVQRFSNLRESRYDLFMKYFDQTL